MVDIRIDVGYVRVWVRLVFEKKMFEFYLKEFLFDVDLFR